jgi:hypothetical protein
MTSHSLAFRPETKGEKQEVELPPSRFERLTPALQVRCSTPELRGREHCHDGYMEGFWEGLLACLHADLHLVCGWQLTFLLHVCRLAQFSALSGGLLCVSLSRVGC